MTENEIIDFLEDEINGLKEQKYGELGEIAAKVFKEINGDERIKVFRVAISALEEIQQYREIGTVEECRKALERRKPKRAVFDCMIGNWEGIFNCPACGKVILRDCGDVENTFCERCGQAIRWG